MNVIVSKSCEDNYSDFIVVRDVEQIETLQGVDILVLHDIGTDSYNVGLLFPKWVEMGITTFIYINKDPEIKISMLVNGLNESEGIVGACYDEEFYLDEEEDLKYLIEDAQTNQSQETTELVTTSGSIIRNFCKLVATGDPKANSPLTLNQVNDAVNELVEVNESQTQMITSMNQSAIDMFERTSRIIESMDKQSKLIKKQLEDLQSAGAQTRHTPFANSVLVFPEYNYSNIATVLVVKEYTPCRYLTSFLLTYEHYLHYVKNKKVKFIIVHSKGALVSKRYESFVSITQESEDKSSLYDEACIATNYPKTTVMRELFSKHDDIYIIIDRTYQKEHIVTGRVKSLNAVGGMTAVKQNNLKVEETIFSVENRGKDFQGFLTIPKIKPFPDSQDRRFGAYNQLCRSMMEKLDDFLELPK